MRLNFIAVLFCLMWLTALPAQNNVREIVQQMVRFDTEIAFDKTPGYIMAVIDGDSTFVESFGRSLAHPDSILNPTDIFEIGGLSKVITSLLFQDLLSQHNLSLNQSVSHHFPAELKDKIDQYGWTYKSLLTHTSGLPKIPAGLGSKEVNSLSPYAQYTTDDLMSYLKETGINKKRHFLYGHINYALIEYIIEDITQKKYTIVLKKYLKTRYDIQDTDVYTDTKPTPGYNRARKISEPQTYASFGAALGIKSTLSDLTILLKSMINLESGDHDLAPVIDEKTKTKLDKKLFFTTTLYRMENKKFYPLYLHSGRSNGHYAFLGFVPATKTGVLILANSAEGTEDLGLLMLRAMNDTWKRKAYE